MKSWKGSFVLSVMVFALLAAVLYILAGRFAQGVVTANEPLLRVGQTVADDVANGDNPAQEVIQGHVRPLSPLAQAIADAEFAIANGADARTVLADLSARLFAAGQSAAAKAILEYLDSGRDCITGLAFKVGPGGVMISTPTMRTFLLDLLAAVDPQVALDYAETVFEAPKSADEFAICLRNVGRLDSSDTARAYIRMRAGELLANAEFAESPTAGFVEAFDALVYAGGVDSIAILSGFLAEQKGRALNVPAFIALDRLVIENTEASLTAILDSPALFDERPLARAGYFARADLASDAQLDVVEEYVLELGAGGEEAEYFFSILPNLNFMLVDGILTERLSITYEYTSERVDAALASLERWETDARFSRFGVQIRNAISRIREIRGE